MTIASAAALGIGAALLAWLGAWRLIGALKSRDILDRPTERSSHSAPTPRGGGIAVVGAVALGWAGVALQTPAAAGMWVVLAAALALAALSWRDDRAGLPAHVRLAGHAAAVAAALWSMPGLGGLFGAWMPAWLGVALVALAWLWFVNLFNFMDGIDGIAAGEALSIGLGAMAVAGVVWLDALLNTLGVAGAAAALDPAMAASAAMGGVAAAAALGFLWWNWHPARIFLGDVGSVPLGFLIGYLLLRLAEAGQWVAALILPLYFLADATITLLRRALRRERVWRAHKEHFYQRAVAAGMSHAQVTILVLSTNAALIGCAAIAAAGLGWLGLLGAAAAVAAALAILARA